MVEASIQAVWPSQEDEDSIQNTVEISLANFDWLTPNEEEPRSQSGSLVKGTGKKLVETDDYTHIDEEDPLGLKDEPLDLGLEDDPLGLAYHDSVPGTDKVITLTSKQRTNAKHHSCKVCCRSFSTNLLYTSHACVRDRSEIKCSECPELFRARSDLHRHQWLTKHRGSALLSQKRSMTFSCPFCPAAVKFLSEKGLKIHINRMHASQSDKENCDDPEEEETATKPNQKTDEEETDTKPVLTVSCSKAIFFKHTENCIEPTDEEKYSKPTGKRKRKKRTYNKNITERTDKEKGTKHTVVIENCSSHTGEENGSDCNGRVKEECFESEDNSSQDNFETSLRENVAGKRPAPEKSHPCPSCPLLFRSLSSLAYHRATAHQSLTFACPDCDRLFRHPQLLHRHSLVHSQERPFPCPSCPLRFKSPQNLANHTKTHTQEKRHACHVCDKRFHHLTGLNQHLRLHTGSRPFLCGVCGKASSQLGNHRQHLLIHSGERRHSCNSCQKRFVTKSQLKAHLATHEKTRLTKKISIPKEKSSAKKRKKQTDLLPKKQTDLLSKNQPLVLTSGVSYIINDVTIISGDITIPGGLNSYITMPSDSNTNITLPSDGNTNITIPSDSNTNVTIPSDSNTYVTMHNGSDSDFTVLSGSNNDVTLTSNNNVAMLSGSDVTLGNDINSDVTLCRETDPTRRVKNTIRHRNTVLNRNDLVPMYQVTGGNGVVIDGRFLPDSFVPVFPDSTTVKKVPKVVQNLMPADTSVQFVQNSYPSDFGCTAQVVDDFSGIEILTNNAGGISESSTALKQFNRRNFVCANPVVSDLSGIGIEISTNNGGGLKANSIPVECGKQFDSTNHVASNSSGNEIFVDNVDDISENSASNIPIKYGRHFDGPKPVVNVSSLHKISDNNVADIYNNVSDIDVYQKYGQHFDKDFEFVYANPVVCDSSGNKIFAANVDGTSEISGISMKQFNGRNFVCTNPVVNDLPEIEISTINVGGISEISKSSIGAKQINGRNFGFTNQVVEDSSQKETSFNNVGGLSHISARSRKQKYGRNHLDLVYNTKPVVNILPQNDMSAEHIEFSRLIKDRKSTKSEMSTSSMEVSGIVNHNPGFPTSNIILKRNAGINYLNLSCANQVVENLSANESSFSHVEVSSIANRNPGISTTAIAQERNYGINLNSQPMANMSGNITASHIDVSRTVSSNAEISAACIAPVQSIERNSNDNYRCLAAPRDISPIPSDYTLVSLSNGTLLVTNQAVQNQSQLICR